MRIYGLKPKGGEGRFFHAQTEQWGTICFIIRHIGDDLIPEEVVDELAVEVTEISDYEICGKLAYRIEAFIDVGFDSNSFVAPFDEETLELNCPYLLDMKEQGMNENNEYGGPLSPLSIDKQRLLKFVEFLKACGGFITKQ